jgi:negative regulator of sigma E activity
VDAAERIADYLSDDLAPDEREAFEAALAGDAALRAQLDAAKRADHALAAVDPVELPDGFAQRLRAALDAELADVLAPVVADEPDPRVAAQAELAQRDDLAARRAARAMPRWVGALAGAAAAVLVVVAGVAGLSSISGGADESPESATGESLEADDGAADEVTTMEAPAEDSAAGADEEFFETEETEEAEGDAAEQDGFSAVARQGDGPVLVAEGRSLDEDDLDAVLLTPDLTDLAAQRLPASEGEALAREYDDRWQTALTDGSGARTAGSPSDADREAVVACLASASDDGRDDGIPAYAEIADYQGTPVVVLGLVTLDPDTDTWSVPEVRVLDRATCDLLAARP